MSAIAGLREGTLGVYLSVPGHPVSLKNDRRIIYRAGTPKSIKAGKAGPWMDDAILAWRLGWAQISSEPIPREVALNAAIVSFAPATSRLDPTNTYGAPLDALQAAGVIANDRQVCSVDGSDLLVSEDPRVCVWLTLYSQRSAALAQMRSLPALSGAGVRVVTL